MKVPTTKLAQLEPNTERAITLEQASIHQMQAKRLQLNATKWPTSIRSYSVQVIKTFAMRSALKYTAQSRQIEREFKDTSYG